MPCPGLETTSQGGLHFEMGVGGHSQILDTGRNPLQGEEMGPRPLIPKFKEQTLEESLLPSQPLLQAGNRKKGGKQG